jgi:DNA-binding transcriptional regulator YdaS (Cro superfamily)
VIKERPAELYRLFIVARGMAALARTLGLNAQTVRVWKRVPAHHLAAIYRIYKIHPVELRPDLFEDKPEKRKKPLHLYKRYKYRRFRLHWHEIDPDPLD